MGVGKDNRLPAKFLSAEGLKHLWKRIEDHMGDAVRSAGVPSGCVIIWSGIAENIPTGWALCNGENGTPDLRGRFILGASPDMSEEMGSPPESAIKEAHQTGGEAAHKLTINEMPSHRHYQDYNTVYRDYTGLNSAYSLPNYRDFANDASDGQYIEGYTLETGGGQSHNNMPPYYALCYIMKL